MKYLGPSNCVFWQEMSHKKQILIKCFKGELNPLDKPSMYRSKSLSHIHWPILPLKTQSKGKYNDFYSWQKRKNMTSEAIWWIIHECYYVIFSIGWKKAMNIPSRVKIYHVDIKGFECLWRHIQNTSFCHKTTKIKEKMIFFITNY